MTTSAISLSVRSAQSDSAAASVVSLYGFFRLGKRNYLKLGSWERRRPDHRRGQNFARAADNARRRLGVVMSRGRRVGTAEGPVTDGRGRLLAHGTTTCLIFQC